MPEFPRREPEIIELTRRFIGGAENTAANELHIIVPLPEVKQMFTDFLKIKADITQREAELTGLYEAKKKLLGDLVKAIKRNLKMLESYYRKNAPMLARYGWGVRRRARRTTVPGQPRLFEAIKQETNAVVFDWKSPLDGGKAKYYEIYRLTEGETEWQFVKTSFKREIRVTDQPRKLDLKYYVVAVNKAGKSLPSNIVSVVL